MRRPGLRHGQQSRSIGGFLGGRRLGVRKYHRRRRHLLASIDLVFTHAGLPALRPPTRTASPGEPRLHAANAVLLFLVLRRMTGAFWRSAVVAALFAWHPLQVESVAWISERKNVLSGFCFFLILLGYHRYARQPNLPRYLLVFFLLCLGLMAKPTLVIVPFLLLVLDFRSEE